MWSRIPHFWDLQKPSAKRNILRRLRSTEFRHNLVLFEFIYISEQLFAPKIFWRAIIFLITRPETALKATQELDKHEHITVQNDISTG